LPSFRFQCIVHDNNQSSGLSALCNGSKRLGVVGRHLIEIIFGLAKSSLVVIDRKVGFVVDIVLRLEARSELITQ